MKRDNVISFDGDTSSEGHDNLIKALEEQLEKYKKGDGEKSRSADQKTKGGASNPEIRNV